VADRQGPRRGAWSSLPAIVDAHDLIDPVIVAPRAKLRAAAEAAGIDLAPYAIEDVPHSHAAAARAAVLCAIETVNPQMRSTIDAAALSKMAERRPRARRARADRADEPRRYGRRAHRIVRARGHRRVAQRRSVGRRRLMHVNGAARADA
jgi:hypothetical protein